MSMRTRMTFPLTE